MMQGDPRSGVTAPSCYPLSWNDLSTLSFLIGRSRAVVLLTFEMSAVECDKGWWLSGAEDGGPLTCGR